MKFKITHARTRFTCLGIIGILVSLMWLGGAFNTTPAAADNTLVVTEQNNSLPSSASLAVKDADVLKLVGSPHLFVIQNGQRRWLADTMAAASIPIDWGSLREVNETELKTIPADPPILTYLLLRDDTTVLCCPIYLVKQEVNQPPTRFWIQYIRDVEIFGINEQNYGSFVQNQAAWETTYKLKANNMPSATLSTAIPLKITINNPNVTVTVDRPAKATDTRIEPAFGIVNQTGKTMIITIVSDPPCCGVGYYLSVLAGTIRPGQLSQLNVYVQGSVQPGTYTGSALVRTYVDRDATWDTGQTVKYTLTVR